MASKLYDVLIIGGGPGGLAVATALARLLHTAVVFDSGVYRNARATHMHGVLGFDHVPPADFRVKARQDILARYDTISFQDVEVKTIEKMPQNVFKAVDANGKCWFGRRVALATGVRDIAPDIPGFQDCWARGIFHCLFCHGYEERGRESIGLLATGLSARSQMAMLQANMGKSLAKKVTIYTNGVKSAHDEFSALVKGTAYAIDHRTIASLTMGKGSDVVITFASGETITEGFLVNAPLTEIYGPLAKDLGVELLESGEIKTGQIFPETNVPGVFAAGDCGSVFKAVSFAAAQGGLCAAGIITSLGQEKPMDKEEVENLLKSAG